jgi:hypothetical protein
VPRAFAGTVGRLNWQGTIARQAPASFALKRARVSSGVKSTTLAALRTLQSQTLSRMTFGNTTPGNWTKTKKK